MYFDEPTQVIYKYHGQSQALEGIAFLDQVIDADSGLLVDLAEILIIETKEDWTPLTHS